MGIKHRLGMRTNDLPDSIISTLTADLAPPSSRHWRFFMNKYGPHLFLLNVLTWNSQSLALCLPSHLFGGGQSCQAKPSYLEVTCSNNQLFNHSLPLGMRGKSKRKKPFSPPQHALKTPTGKGHQVEPSVIPCPNRPAPKYENWKEPLSRLMCVSHMQLFDFFFVAFNRKWLRNEVKLAQQINCSDKFSKLAVGPKGMLKLALLNKRASLPCSPLSFFSNSASSVFVVCSRNQLFSALHSRNSNGNWTQVIHGLGHVFELLVMRKRKPIYQTKGWWLFEQ